MLTSRQHQCQKICSRENKLKLKWVPSHISFKGNEETARMLSGIYKHQNRSMVNRVIPMLRLFSQHTSVADYSSDEKVLRKENDLW